ncbi:MAG: putative LPS assembly protein LptD, partial [Holophaga sp.]|nr:putative LPS assembly protein LptD [Holophaga sp.]
GTLTACLTAQNLPPLPPPQPPAIGPSQTELLPLRPFSFEKMTGDGLSLRWRGERVREEGDTYFIESGALQSEDLLLLADHISYNKRTGILEANGKIRLEGPDLRLRCERLRMDWKQRIGDAWALELELPPSWTLRSSHVAFTTLKEWNFEAVELSPCPQEKPGWSARVSRMKLQLEGFATFRNAQIRVGGIPVLYLPWAAYPAKAERSSGLLPPQLGYSSHLGTSVGLSYFQVLGKTMDLTFSPEYYSKEGTFWGGEYRWNPELTHHGSLQGQYIHQKSNGEHRYRYRLQELWQREDGWQFTADINQSSDTLLESDYGRASGGLGTAGSDSAIFLGKSFSWASFNVSAAEQQTYFLPEDNGFYRPEFPSSLRRQSLPQIQARIYPIPLGIFYLDGAANLSRFAYRLDLGKDQTGGQYKWNRGDFSTRLHGRLGQWGPFRADFQMAARFTRYSSSLKASVFDASGSQSGDPLDLNSNPAFDPFRVNGDAVQRFLGSGRLQLSGPQLGRTFEKVSLLGYAGDVKHVLEPFLALTKNSRSSIAGKLPRFDEVDSRPGVGGSADGEQSIEIGLKQHLLGRPGKGSIFADLVRWRISTRYHSQPILLSDGRFKRGWASIDNDFDIEPNSRLRLSFRRSSELGSSAADNSLSAEYTSLLGNRFSLAAFTTGINRYLVRQQGIQVGGINRFFDDQWRLEYQANYDIRTKGFVFSQVALAYVTPCVATRLRYSHVAIQAPGALNKEDRVDLVLTLRSLGDLFSLKR